MFRILALLIFITFSSYAQNDSIVIRNYNTGNLKAASFNYMGILAENGFYYFANEDGLLQYDGSTWSMHSIDNNSGVFSMAQGSDERIYIGGLNEFGYVEKDSIGQFQYTSLRDKISSDSTIAQIWQTIVSDSSVYYLSYDRILHWDGHNINHIAVEDAFMFEVNGGFYASIFNGDIVKLEKDTITTVSNKIKFQNDAAFQILKGPEDKYIIFTSENGFFLFDERTYSIEPWEVPASEFFKGGYLYTAIDWKDSLYICTSSNKGLVFIDKAGNVVHKLTKENGLPTNFLRELFVDQYDNLWITTDYGISYVRWPELNEPKIAPATMITKAISRDVTRETPYLSDIQISHDVPITIHFATPGIDKEEIEYSYYLEGHDSEWSEWNNIVSKEYSNLDGGTYTFIVRGRLYNGLHTEPAKVKFYIYKPWYLSGWFITGGILGLLLVIYAIIKLRTLHLSRLNRQLELLVEERTTELVAQKERLKSVNHDLRVMNSELDNFVYRSSHDLIAPLKSLKGLINLAKIDNPGEHQLHYLKIMNSSVLKLEEFIKSIMEYSINSKRAIEFKEVVLDKIIEEIREEIKYYDKAEEVELIKDFKSEFALISDSSRLKIIFSNLITNAVKYHNYDQNNPYIKVVADQVHNGVVIKIEDNGLGIQEEYLPKIYDMFFRASETAEGSGLGLYIVKDTVEKLEASIEVESVYRKGTVFTLFFKN